MITHANIRSLNKNISELQLLYDHSLKFKFDIIALSEVWNVRNTDTLPLINKGLRFGGQLPPGI